MKLLIKKAIIVSPSSPHNGKQTDILITDGIISAIGSVDDVAVDKIIEQDNLHISIGWMDLFANFGEPGYEYKETIETGINAAAAGGFTDVAVIPNTKPVIDNKAYVEFVKHKAASFLVNVHPLGSITKNTEGKELAEMYDMYQSGAVGFTDGRNALQTAGIMLKALQYMLPISATIIQMPEDKTLGTHGLMNEGIASTQLGLPGKPAIAEELMIANNIELAKYTESKIHFTGISTKRSVELVNKAKQEGVKVTCSVTPYHLFFCDDDLNTYDTNLKVNPPLRTKDDRDALLAAVKNGDIDCIASHHLPQEWDSKVCEFEYAKNGMIGLETMFSILMKLGLSVNEFVKMQSINARNIVNLTLPEITVGAKTCLTLFNPNTEFVFEETMIKSKSKNTPFIGTALKGKVMGIINGDKTNLI